MRLGGKVAPGSGVFRIFYLLFIPVIWIALRWGAVGATLGLLTIQVGILVAVAVGTLAMVPLRLRAASLRREVEARQFEIERLRARQPGT